MDLYRFYIYALAITPVFLYAWAISDPFTVLDLLFRFRRYLRRKAEQYYGKREANEIIKDFKAFAIKKGYSKELIDLVIKENRPRLINKFGKIVADKLHGKFEPDPMERDH